MAKSLLWLTNKSGTDNTEVRVFDTSDQAELDITNVVWSYTGDFAKYMNTAGTEFLTAEWEFHYWEKSTRSDEVVLFQGWTGPVSPDQLQTLLNDGSLPASPLYNTADMGTWTVVQETTYTGESSDDVDVIEEDVKYQFTITCDLDATWYFENVDPAGGEGEDDDFARGAGILKINTGTGFEGTINPLYDPDNYYIAELKTPDGDDANLIKIDSYRDFNYNTLRQSVGPVNLKVKEFAVYSNNPNQLLQPFIFDRKTAAGKQYQKVIAPVISPYQQQRYVKTPDMKGYIVDGFTKLNYTVLANTSVRIIMDYSEEMLPMKGVKNPASVKPIGFVGMPRESYSNQSGPGTPLPQGVNQGVFNPLKEEWVEMIKDRKCKGLARTKERLEDRLSQLQSDGRNILWQKYLKERIEFVEKVQKEKDCIINITPGPETVKELAEQESILHDAEFFPTGLWLPTDNFTDLRLMPDDEKRLLEDIDFPIDNE